LFAQAGRLRHKDAVFSELHRVLVPGRRIQIAKAQKFGASDTTLKAYKARA